jgi:hypothetical protein
MRFSTKTTPVLGSTLTIALLSVALALISTVVVHYHVNRPNLKDNLERGLGTLYLNSLLGTPITSPNLEPDRQDLARYPKFSNFCTKIVAHAKSYCTLDRADYDVWVRGFEPARGWPFVSKVPSAMVVIDVFHPGTTDHIAQYSFEADDSGLRPVRYFSLTLNFAAYQCIFVLLLLLANFGFRQLPLRRRYAASGFPVLPADGKSKAGRGTF